MAYLGWKEIADAKTKKHHNDVDVHLVKISQNTLKKNDAFTGVLYAISDVWFFKIVK